MELLFKGKVHKFGDNVDTDVIIPARYLNTTDPKELGRHCMEDLDADFSSEVKRGDIIAAGENFGCGSSREHAPIAIKTCGISCVIAKSFARIFFRNAINIGLPILTLAEADKIEEGNILEIDFKQGKIKNLSKNKEYAVAAFPDFIMEIMGQAGLINYLKAKK